MVERLSHKEKKTLLEKMVKLQEEVGELAEAILIVSQAPGSRHKTSSAKKIREEVIDILLVGIDIYLQQKGTIEEFQSLMAQKIQKWNKQQSK